MPSASRAQHNLMAMVANDPAAAKRLGIPQKVGKEFVQADRGRHFEAHKAEGGTVKKESPAMMKKELSFMKKKGAPKSMIAHEKAEAGMKKGGAAYAKGGGIESKGKTKGKTVKMMGGGKC